MQFKESSDDNMKPSSRQVDSGQKAHNGRRGVRKYLKEDSINHEFEQLAPICKSQNDSISDDNQTTDKKYKKAIEICGKIQGAK